MTGQKLSQKERDVFEFFRHCEEMRRLFWTEYKSCSKVTPITSTKEGWDTCTNEKKCLTKAIGDKLRNICISSVADGGVEEYRWVRARALDFFCVGHHQECIAGVIKRLFPDASTGSPAHPPRPFLHGVERRRGALRKLHSFPEERFARCTASLMRWAECSAHPRRFAFQLTRHIF